MRLGGRISIENFHIHIVVTPHLIYLLDFKQNFIKFPKLNYIKNININYK